MMLTHLTQSFSRMAVRPVAGPSLQRVPAISASGVTSNSSGLVQRNDVHANETDGLAYTSRRRFSSFVSSPLARSSSSSSPFATRGQARHAAQLAPKRTKYRKAHRGKVPLHVGGSLKGTTLNQGIYGIRLLEPARLSAKQLQSADVALKRKLKVIKGAQVYLRVFPDIPVCGKGNETRMGKGKGSFQFWAVRATVGKVIFEIGGPVEIRPEVAKEALRLASAKLPVRTEFVTRESAPRLGGVVETSLPPGAAATQGRMPGAQQVIAGRQQQTASPLASVTGVPSISSTEPLAGSG